MCPYKYGGLTNVGKKNHRKASTAATPLIARDDILY
jgi:hypothetical protein